MNNGIVFKPSILVAFQIKRTGCEYARVVCDTTRCDTIRGWHQLAHISVGNLPQRVQTILHVATASMFRNPFLWFVMLGSKVIDSRRFVHLLGSLARVLLFCIFAALDCGQNPEAR
jgi:hypothetical protein